MEPEVPNLFIMLSTNIIEHPDTYLGKGTETEINDAGDRAPNELSDDRKRVIGEGVRKVVEYQEMLDYTKGVLSRVDFQPMVINWMPKRVTETLLKQVFSYAHKADTPKETLVVLDRPTHPDAALQLMVQLRVVAEQLNSLDCNVKVRFGLLGEQHIHEV